MSSREIIDLILGKYKTKCGTLSSFVSNDNLSSFYISQQRSNNLPPVQIRLSNHGTYLRTWVDRVNLNNSKGRLFNPSHCINISIVFLDEDSDLTNDCEGQINCDDCQITPCIPQTFEGQNELGHSFTVYQFVYKSKCIKRRYIDGIVNAIISALKQGVYKDSLANIEQKASTKELKSNYTPQNTSVNKNKTNENKEYKINKNMKKQVIRLTESDLKNIIKESVERILNEGKVVNNKGIFNDYWDGWRKEKPGFCVNRDINNFKKPPIGADNEYLKYFDNKEDFENAIKKHNERTGKYTGGYLTRKASEDNYRWKQNSRRNLARHFKDMLHFNNISSHTYYKSSPEKRNYYWDKYFRDYNREYNAIENERQETAYWNNLMDMAYGSNGW